jgi:hypothetical protein
VVRGDPERASVVIVDGPIAGRFTEIIRGMCGDPALRVTPSVRGRAPGSRRWRSSCSTATPAPAPSAALASQRARGEIVVWIDADMTYPNERILERSVAGR